MDGWIIWMDWIGGGRCRVVCTCRCENGSLFRERGERHVFFSLASGCSATGAEAGERAALLLDCLQVTCRGNTGAQGLFSIQFQGIVAVNRES